MLGRQTDESVCATNAAGDHTKSHHARDCAVFWQQWHRQHKPATHWISTNQPCNQHSDWCTSFEVHVHDSFLIARVCMQMYCMGANALAADIAAGGYHASAMNA